MSDQSDHEDEHELDSDAADDISTEQGSDEPETDQSGNFFDLEAEESGGDDYDEDESEDGNHGEEYSFPQFSRLPPELRTIIWESIDPYLRSPRRVLEFQVVRTGVAPTSWDDDPGPSDTYASFRVSYFSDGPGSSDSDSDASSFIDYAALNTPDSPLDPCDLWESALLAWQTAPARTLLATNKESRYLALKYYPNVIKIRRGSGHVRFNGANDIIFLNLYRSIDASILSPWCHKVKYLAFHLKEEMIANRNTRLTVTGDLARDCKDVEAIFYCLDAADVGHYALGWSVSPDATNFYVEAIEFCPNPLIYRKLYCWSGEDLSTKSALSIIKDTIHVWYSGISGLPMRLMTQYTSNRGIALYHKAMRYYLRNHDRDETPIESSSEGESVYESELDDYELDGFVVDGTSEGNGGSTDDEDGGASVDGSHESVDDANLSDINPVSDDFNGFSPLQDPSDDEETSHLPDAVSATGDLGSHESAASGASSPKVQPRAAKRSGRHKRRIISSDGEDDDSGGGGGGGGSAVRSQPRIKRARFTVSDSEDEGSKDQSDGGGDTGSGMDKPSRLKKRARVVVLSDSEEDEEGEKDDEEEDGGPARSRRRRPPRDSSEEDASENEDEDEEEGDDESDEEEPEASSKPLSLLARLRQFRSDVPVSPEGDSPGSAQEYDEEDRDEEDGEQPVYDAEFPASAEEDGGEDGW